MSVNITTMASVIFSLSLPVSPSPCRCIFKNHNFRGFMAVNYSGSRVSRSRSLVSAVTDVAFSSSPLIHIPVSSPKEVSIHSLLANSYSNEILYFELYELV